jgi:hypothetical protein
MSISPDTKMVQENRLGNVVLIDSVSSGWTIYSELYIFSDRNHLLESAAIPVSLTAAARLRSELDLDSIVSLPYANSCFLGELRGKMVSIYPRQSLTAIYTLVFSRGDYTGVNVFGIEYDTRYSVINLFIPVCTSRRFYCSLSNELSEKQVQSMILRYSKTANFFTIQGKLRVIAWEGFHPAIRERVKLLLGSNKKLSENPTIFSAAHYFLQDSNTLSIFPLYSEDYRVSRTIPKGGRRLCLVH